MTTVVRALALWVLAAAIGCGQSAETPRSTPAPARYLVSYQGACGLRPLPEPEIWAATSTTIKLGSAEPWSLVPGEADRWTWRAGNVRNAPPCTVTSALTVRIDSADLLGELIEQYVCDQTTVCVWIVRGSRE